MTTELRELYQQVILDHNKKPRNFHVLEGANRTAEGYNPLCGDQITLYLRLEDGVVKDAAFQGKGCAISKASASMMTAAVIGKPLDEVESLFQRLHTMLTGETGASGDGLGKPSSLVSASSPAASSAPPWPGTRCMPRSAEPRRPYRRSKPRRQRRRRTAGDGYG